MKTDKKTKITILLVLAALSFNAAADDDEILLPDISTTILKTDDGINVEKEAVPDFRSILPETGDDLPDIADAGLPPDAFIPPKTDYTADAPDSKEAVTSDVFIEGSVGGGYPGLFSGDFSVYRNEGAEPFSLKFSHLTENGYGRHSASDGFSTSVTSLSGQKRFAFTDKLRLDLEGVYSTKTDGLQGKSPLFYTLYNQDISARADFIWDIDERMKLSSDMGVIFNNQFAGYNVALPNGVSGSSICFMAKPRVSFLYTLPFENGTQLDMLARAGYDGGTNQNRVSAGLALDYIIADYGTASASVDVVWTKNMASPIAVPFQLGFKTGSAVSVIGSVFGGLKSSSADFAALQQTIPYMFTNFKPFEETLWFASADLTLPFEFSRAEGETPAFAIKKIEPDIKVDFEKTAFGNKSLSLFSVDTVTGLMTAQLAERLALDTSFSTTFSFLIGGTVDLNLSAGWKGCWFDKDVLEESHLLLFKLGVSDENGSWGVETDVTVSFMDEVPDVGFSAFYKLTNAMRLELKLADFVKLVMGEDRLLCGEYIQRGGYAALYVKIFF